MVKILLSGCSGKMGNVIQNVISEFPSLKIVAGIDKFPKESEFKIFKNTEDVNIHYDVLLDFSRADALKDLLALTTSTKKPLVLCSTGYTDEDLKLIEDSFKTAEERSHFSELLFNELLVNKIENRLKLISTILKDIGGLSFLKKIGTKRYQITTQQLDIFIELFPSEKKMLERKREKIKE